MTRGSRAVAKKSDEPKEWKDGAARADEVREVVGLQLVALLAEQRTTGSRDVFVERVRQVSVQARMGDPVTLRAAVMEAALAAAAWAVAMDLNAPSGMVSR
jgi:hypothetical protein